MSRKKIIYIFAIGITLILIALNIKIETDFRYPNTPNLEAIQNMNGYPLKVRISQEKLYGVKIAIIDSGIDGNQKNLTLNEIASSQRFGDKSHGTIIASVIGARECENLNFNGILPGITLYTYDIHSDTLNTETLSKAIDEVSHIGVDVINISLSTYKDTPSLKNSVEKAVNSGITIVASVGNDSSKQYSYPASYKIPGVISVGALDENLDVWSLSNFNDTVDIFVPGTKIYSINHKLSGDSVEIFNGTSLAAPLVTTWVAMLLATNPNLTPKNIESIIQETARRHLVNWKQSRVNIQMADINGSLLKAINFVE
ncbi:hypothetical protein BAG01nite_16800 [Brevibacillus agri]|nr:MULTISPECIES: S8 family serine peptidase [Brevibacillus]MBY0050958.1 S8 family serine peptidase [Brevibacillus agri]MCG5253549.1 S8 family serine peptidase [Brevibacillus agri]MED3501356.1 S8 family serine peptidase [Brevibacillus agri]MED4572240.1 S8 family serine peptidase [Brevibacillus agri]QHZ57928.1 S8 family serine peptidase [Brevibacillus sp. NSP2.1]